MNSDILLRGKTVPTHRFLVAPVLLLATTCVLLASNGLVAQRSNRNLSPAWNDAYEQWESDVRFHFGNRMNDIDAIQRDSAATGFRWDGLPYHELNEQEGGMTFHFRAGEMALEHSAQIRLAYPKIDPARATFATFAWEAKYDPRFFTGGKAFQISEQTSGDKRRIEHNPVLNVGKATEPTWLMLPATRVYGPTDVGGNGRSELLSCGLWEKRNVQCALDAPGRNHTYSYAVDHVTGSRPRAFLVKPGQWYRYIYTLDWQTKPHRVFLWMEAEDTPRTLVMSEERNHDAGFVVQWVEEESGSDQFWFEFNNSRSLNEHDFDVHVRNFFIVRDVSGDEL